jgi:hypothetical protein
LAGPFTGGTPTRQILPRRLSLDEQSGHHDLSGQAYQSPPSPGLRTGAESAGTLYFSGEQYSVLQSLEKHMTFGAGVTDKAKMILTRKDFSMRGTGGNERFQEWVNTTGKREKAYVARVTANPALIHRRADEEFSVYVASDLWRDILQQAEWEGRPWDLLEDINEFICREIIQQFTDRRMDSAGEVDIIQAIAEAVKWTPTEGDHQAYHLTFTSVITDMNEYLHMQKHIQMSDTEFLSALFRIIPYEVATYFVNGIVEAVTQRSNRRSFFQNPLGKLQLPDEQSLHALVSNKKALLALMHRELKVLSEGSTTDVSKLIPSNAKMPSKDVYPKLAHLMVPENKRKFKGVNAVGKFGGKSPKKEATKDTKKSPTKNDNKCYHCGEANAAHLGKDCAKPCYRCKEMHPGKKCRAKKKVATTTASSGVEEL